jgi:DNA polymerase III subunit epsilon
MTTQLNRDGSWEDWKEGMVQRATEAPPIVEWARRVIKDPRTVFLDTETTGFGRSAGIVDLAIVATDGTVLIDTLINPRRPIPSGASRVHGILDRDVVDAPVWDELLPDVIAALSGRRVIVYNVGFDRPIIEEHCGQCGTMIEVALWECAMRAYAEFYGQWQGLTSGYRWQSLMKACLHLGIQPGYHRALGDAIACRNVVVQMAKGFAEAAWPATIVAFPNGTSASS